MNEPPGPSVVWVESGPVEHGLIDLLLGLSRSRGDHSCDVEHVDLETLQPLLELLLFQSLVLSKAQTDAVKEEPSMRDGETARTGAEQDDTDGVNAAAVVGDDLCGYPLQVVVCGEAVVYCPSR